MRGITALGILTCIVEIYYVCGIEGAVVTSTTPRSTGITDDQTSETSTLSLNQTSTTADPLSQVKAFEEGWKRIFKQGVKSILPRIMNYGGNTGTSSTCLRALTKYIGALQSAKVWAARMFDATSKIPPGLFDGTFSDFGSFDECLDIRVPQRNGKEEFRGSYCAIEAVPFMPPVPKNFSMAIRRRAGPHETIGKQLLLTGGGFYYLKLRFGICVPSSCSVEDIRSIASAVAQRSRMNVEIPQCYVMEDGVTLSALHIVVICILALLVILCLIGTRIDVRNESLDEKARSKSFLSNALMAFSLRRNYLKLMGSSDGGVEFKALHGIRSLSIAWVVLGHNYVWSNFQLLSRPANMQDWFNRLDFEAILNAWLSVEPFFFLSGLLTCYGCMRLMQVTKGKINILLFIVRRYIRLAPPLLMVMGLIFFLPLISSGPFWYERVDPELNACRSYWWTSVLFFNNWTKMKNVCMHPTWYLSADFQLHIISLLVLFPLYRSTKLGMLTLSLLLGAANLAIGVITYVFELPPIIQISSGNNELILKTVDEIHIRTFTHLGPYMIGMATGYIIYKHKEIKLSKLTVFCGWCISIILSLSSLYGAHTWNVGLPHGPLITSLYAAIHRSSFIVGVAWVAFACVTGHAGPVNSILSSPLLAPFSRLTFCIYLTHGLAIWTRRASVRERMYYSHYNCLYDYIGNLVVSILLALPLHLLVEAPVSSLDRLIFSGMRPSPKHGKPTSEAPASHTKPYTTNGVPRSITSMRTSASPVDNTVELQSVKTIQESTHHNGGHNGLR